jgi:hypothetical protein
VGDDTNDKPRERQAKYPNLMLPWKPGQSGNRSGKRNKVPVSLTRILREKLAETSVGDQEMPGGRTVAETLIEVLLAEVIQNRTPTLAKEFFNRIDGRVPSKVEIDAAGGALSEETIERHLNQIYDPDGEGAEES